jgi:hypothetical protein
MLGIEPSKVRSGYAKFDVQNPPLNLALNEITFNERGALSHTSLFCRAKNESIMPLNCPAAYSCFACRPSDRAGFTIVGAAPSSRRNFDG